MSSSTEPVCACCGGPLSAHDRHVRLKLPQPVLAVPKDEREGRTWGNDVLMSVRDVGDFVRVLIPIHIEDGTSLTFGAWLAVEQADLHRAYEVWWEPEYVGLELDGVLANHLPPWEDGVLGAPAQARVLDPDAVPYMVSSTDPLLSRVLTEVWPYDELANGMPDGWMPERP